MNKLEYSTTTVPSAPLSIYTLPPTINDKEESHKYNTVLVVGCTTLPNFASIAIERPCILGAREAADAPPTPRAGVIQSDWLMRQLVCTAFAADNGPAPTVTCAGVVNRRRKSTAADQMGFRCPHA